MEANVPICLKGVAPHLFGTRKVHIVKMQVLKDLLGVGLENLEWYQMAFRAALVFLVAMATINLAGMRSFGSRTPFDVVLSITIGAVFSRCITGHYPMLPCIVAAITLALCHRLVGYLTFRFSTIRLLSEGEGKKLFDHGIFVESNLRRFMISQVDIQKALRENNIDDLESVKAIWYENDGKINVVKKN